MSEQLIQFKDGETVITKRGTKRLPKNTSVTVVTRDQGAGDYVVKDQAGFVHIVKAENLEQAPEGHLTESQIVQIIAGNMDPNTGEVYSQDLFRTLDNNFPGFTEKVNAVHAERSAPQAG